MIGITGLARAGKDTTAQCFIDNHGFVRAGFADALKELAYKVNPLVSVPAPDGLGTCNERYADLVDVFGIEVVKENPEVRRFLQALGTGARDILGADIWVDHLIKSVGDDDVVVPDVRFRNEAQAIVGAGGYIVRVVRTGSGLAGTAALHPSETEMASIYVPGAFTIPNNSSLRRLALEVDNIVHMITGMESDVALAAA